jgi:hypothetical protein
MPLTLKNQIKCDKHKCKKKFEFLPIFQKLVKNLPIFGKSVNQQKIKIFLCRFVERIFLDFLSAKSEFKDQYKPVL